MILMSTNDNTKKNRGFNGLMLEKDYKTWKPVNSIGRAMVWGSAYLITAPIWVPCKIIYHIVYAVDEGIPRKMCGQSYFPEKPTYDSNTRTYYSRDEMIGHGHGGGYY